MYVEISKDNIIVSERAKYITGFFGKAKGLMFSKIKDLVFELTEENKKEASIHMLFVFNKIDVVWLDDNKVVVDIKRGLKPFFGFGIPKKDAKYVIELPNNNSKGLQEGDQLEFKDL